MLRIFVVGLLVSSVIGFQQFQKLIPNGDRVPDPSLPNVLWSGVGHLNAQGGGTRNAFGIDFFSNGKKWDECLCKHDSDGDGKTNGQELGDPNCVWKVGDIAERNQGLSHPGICEPVESEKCQKPNKDILFSSNKPFECEQTNEPDVKTTIYRFNETKVPAKETNYYCQYFPIDLPEGTSEHIIAYEPIINNAQVMHHTIVYGCRKDNAELMANQTRDNPGPINCRDGMGECTEVMLLWTVGINGVCHPNEFGGLIGEGGFVGIWMEHHWNNPDKTEGLTDSSGIKLYHTPVKRADDAGYILWGTTNLELPVGVENYVQEGGCMSQCTKNFTTDSIFITEIIPHMHYYGRAMTVRHERPGEFNKEIFVENNYEYDSPKPRSFLDSPIEIKRGDAIYVNCSFTTTSAVAPTFFGPGTYDEMCFMIALVHPIDNQVSTFCSDADGFGFCNDGLYGEWGDCDMVNFLATLSSGAGVTMYMKLMSHCDPTGLTCKGDNCINAINEVMSSHPCLAGKTSRFVRGILGRYGRYGPDKTLNNMLVSCKGSMESKEEDDHDDHEGHDHEDHDHEDHDHEDPDHKDHDHKDHDHGKHPNKLPQGQCIFDVKDNDNKDDGGASSVMVSPLLMLSVLLIIVFHST